MIMSVMTTTVIMIMIIIMMYKVMKTQNIYFFKLVSFFGGVESYPLFAGIQFNFNFSLIL